MMRALTLTQPWAGLVASGIKLVENRPRRMIKRADYGKQFAIHASREIDEAVTRRIVEIAPELCTDPGQPWFRLASITSAVIAVVKLDGEVVEESRGLRVLHWADRMSILDPEQTRWYFGPVGYVLRNVIALPEPVPCRGWQGFWTLPDDVEQAVRAQLSEAA